jgi:hypothetical protein
VIGNVIGTLLFLGMMGWLLWGFLVTLSAFPRALAIWLLSGNWPAMLIWGIPMLILGSTVLGVLIYVAVCLTNAVKDALRYRRMVQLRRRGSH